MKLEIINNDKLKKLKKIKLLVLIPVLIGTLTMTACSNQDFSNMDGNDITQENQNQKTYQLNIFYSSTENIETKDIIAIFDKNAEIYGSLNVLPGEEDRVMNIYASNYIVSSDLLGEIEVSLQEDEEAHLYIDYLNKTMNVEIKKIKTK